MAKDPYLDGIMNPTKIVKNGDSWRLIWQGQITSPVFNSRGAAEVYRQMLQDGKRQPEY